MDKAFPGRVFEVEAYARERGLLHARSAAAGAEPQVDLVFRGVAYLDLPAAFGPGVEIVPAEMADLAFVRARLDAAVDLRKVFVLRVGVRRFRVVAEELAVSQGLLGLREHPFARPGLTEEGPGGILR